MWKKLQRPLTILFGVLVVAFVAIQFVPVDRSNPPVTMDVVAPAEVRSVLRQSCYDCHSNESNWPWYSYVAPVSWLVAKDVREGREHLNFSTWDRYTTDERSEFVAEAYEEAVEGEMPLPIYLTMHNDARLSREDRQVLHDWAQGTTSDRSAHVRGVAERRDAD
ncbi:MAG: heme-binding domain-containing protein [Acidimicrobiia bacterium]|nr:heme-binding domain-containing protein [Acidimicrobiia bacterium]NNF43694.1 heme-binding domain-containing protein [Phycisphaerales bacterium]RZV42479.1 MAG: heme-binding protein [Acidimicrobiales bacterium]